MVRKLQNLESDPLCEGELFAAGNRKIDYLRISVTDRCNLRCIYCMPSRGRETVAHEDILTFEEIYKFSRIAVRSGVSKVRITGGEPLVRRDINILVEYLSEIPGLFDISMTTNGILLPQHASSLKDAGLKRINISVDSLDPHIYRKITRGAELSRVFEAIQCSISSGFSPVKINVVIMRNINEEIEKFIELAMSYPVHIRFIEYMPRKYDEIITISYHEMIDKWKSRVALEEAPSPEGAGPAKYYTFPGCLGSIGFISPISRHFCHSCNRLRLTATGNLIPCLYSSEEINIRNILKKGDEAILAAIEQALRKKPVPEENRMRYLARHMSRTGG